MTEDLHRYRWLANMFEGITFAFIRGAVDEAVIAAFGGDPGRVRHGVAGILGEIDRYADFDDVNVDSSDVLAQGAEDLWLAHVGEWTVVTDEIGARGLSDETIAALAADAYIAAASNITGIDTFVYAERGTVIAAYYEHPGDADYRYGSEPERLDGLLEGLPLEFDDRVDESAFVSSFELALIAAERVSGVRLTRELLAAPQTQFTAFDVFGDHADEQDSEDDDDLWADAPEQLDDSETSWLTQMTSEVSGGAFVISTVHSFASGDCDDDPDFEDLQAEMHEEAAFGPGAEQAARFRVPEWYAPPTDRLPGVVLLERMLARSDDAVVWLPTASAYPSGVELEFTALRLRTDDELAGDIAEEPFDFEPIDRHGRVSDLVLRIGVEFADGRRTTNLAGYYDVTGRAPERPVLSERFGSAGFTGSDRSTTRLWLWPLPPPGPLKISCVWPAYGIPYSEIVVEAQLLIEAADRSVQLRRA